MVKDAVGYGVGRSLRNKGKGKCGGRGKSGDLKRKKGDKKKRKGKKKRKKDSPH
jgi:hypothetical protein